MTDDDVVKPDAIQRVLRALEDEPDLVVGNAEVAGPDLVHTLLPRKLRIAVDRRLAPARPSELLALAGDLLCEEDAVKAWLPATCSPSSARS